MQYIIILFINFLFCQEAIYFDGQRAKDLIDYQCSFGPRYPGSKGHQQFADSLKVFLDRLVDMNIVYHCLLYTSPSPRDS